MTPEETAMARFAEGCNCAQSVLLAYADRFGLDTGTAMRLAIGFGGGMGRTGGPCGAVTGALMVLGLTNGAELPDREAKERAYGVAREFQERFRARNGAILCPELLGCDLGTAEGREQSRARNLSQTVCRNLVRDAVSILQEMLPPGA